MTRIKGAKVVGRMSYKVKMLVVRADEVVSLSLYSSISIISITSVAGMAKISDSRGVLLLGFGFESRGV